MHFRRAQRRRRGDAATTSFGQRFGSQTSRRDGTRAATRLQLELLESRLALTGVVINEFMALNADGILDEDGDRSDWIELRNTDSVPVNIGGWHLADSNSQWQFPSISLAPNEHLLVFASGKDRAVVGQELHTNFALDGDGESIKLLMPDGVTVVHAFDPFPSQEDNVSYGLGLGSTSIEPLVGEFETVRVHVPTSDVLGTSWTQIGFDDSEWIVGNTGVGYERSPGSDPDYNNYFELDVGALMPVAEARDTLYMRIEFNTAEIGVLQSMELAMRYDDGFVAYLNGHEIARRNLNGMPAWNSSAITNHSDGQAVVYESIPVSAHLDKLVEGENVLAVHGLNEASNRIDFLISPKLEVERPGDPIVGYMVTPTPGAPNQEGTLGFVEDTKFSLDRGFYAEPFMVEITTATPDVQIRYTTDGSEPTATTGLIYDPANPPLITTTTTLRAAGFKPGYSPTNVDTQTYIFLDDVLQQDGSGLLPYQPWSHFSQFGGADADWAMDPSIVNHPLYAGTIKDDMQAVDSVSVVLPWEDLFGLGGIYIAGKNIERAASIELVSPNSGPEFQIDGLVEIMGQTSPNRWNLDKLSFRVTFKQEFTNLDFQLFTDPFFDQGTPDEFDTFVLDAVYNHSWAYGRNSEQRDTAKFIQDQYVADLQNMAGGLAPHGRYIHLYLNGLYWGMYYLHERPDDFFAASYFGGDNDDYDVIKHVRTDVVAGDTTATANYDAMLNAVRQNLSVPANYEAVEEWLDVDNFIDYVIINYYVGNHDWALNTGGKNWYATYNRVDPNGKWRFHSWDAEHVLESLNENRTFLDPSGQPTEIQHQLMSSPEYRLRFADRVQKHMFNGGLMTPETAAEIFAARMEHIDRAIVGESARWGDNRREPAYTRNDWLANMNDLLNNYFPNRTGIVRNQFSAQGWLVPVGAPVFNHYGGTVSTGFQLTIAKPPGSPASGQIYYTLDGTDPRDAGTKQPSGSASLYGGPITIDAGTQVKARIYVGSNSGTDNDWSPIIDATYLLETPFPLRITELHYNPEPRAGVVDEQDMEFIELLNTSSETISLDGVQITQFASTPYTFANGLSLAAGERIIVARNPDVFKSVYGDAINVAPDGYSTANLSNGGERIVLLGPLGETLQDFAWDDSDPWPNTPDGDGPSLEVIDPMGDPSDPANWRASATTGGSPGAASVSTVGDYDGSGIVDDGDRLFWRANFGLEVSPGTSADGNGDGVVDASDYLVWRMALNQSAMSAAAPSAPAAGALHASAAEGADAVEPTSPTATATSDPSPVSLLVPPVEPQQPIAQAGAILNEAPPAAVPEGPKLLLVLDQLAVDEALGNADLLNDADDDYDAASLGWIAPDELLWDDEAWLELLDTSIT